MTKCKVNMLIIFPLTKKLRFSRGQVFAAAGLWFGERNNVEGPTQVAAGRRIAGTVSISGPSLQLTATKLFVTQHKSEIVTDENMNLTSVCFCTFATHKKYPGLNWLQFLKLNYGIEFCINIRR